MQNNSSLSPRVATTPLHWEDTDIVRDQAARAMLAALQAVYGTPAAMAILKRGPAHGVDAWECVRSAIAQAKAAGIK